MGKKKYLVLAVLAVFAYLTGMLLLGSLGKPDTANDLIAEHQRLFAEAPEGWIDSMRKVEEAAGKLPDPEKEYMLDLLRSSHSGTASTAADLIGQFDNERFLRGYKIVMNRDYPRLLDANMSYDSVVMSLYSKVMLREIDSVDSEDIQIAWQRYTENLLLSDLLASLLDGLEIEAVEQALADYDYDFRRSQFGDDASLKDFESALNMTSSTKTKQIMAILARP
jgi:hypothetical protein